MPLVHGKPISAEEVESITSRQFTPERFASLCNAVVWASAKRRCSSLPSLTERVNVKDGGIDAEWQVELPDDQNYSSPLLGPGWNVFQYKQRDIFAQDRHKTFSSLKAGLKGTVKDLHERTNRRPNRYILFTNLDLTHYTGAKNAAKPQKEELREAVLEGYDQPDGVIGKTRLALQATEHRAIETIVALDPRSMTTSDLLALESPHEIIVVIEDPDPDRAKGFVDSVIARPGLKLLITLPLAERALVPNFGRDDRVWTIELGPLSSSQAHDLLKATGTELDFGTELWIVEQAGGNPGILLVAASLGPELRKTAGTFVEDVAHAFEYKARRELGEEAVGVLQLLSLLTHAGIRGKALKEIEVICVLLGDDLQVNTILNALPRLEKAGVVRVGGSYAELIPPLFANHLATSVLRGRFTQLCALFVALEQPGRLRLIRRLRSLKGDEVTRLWDELFGPAGPFRDMPSTLTSLHSLRLVAGAVPEKVSGLLEKHLKETTVEKRLAIKDGMRRELVRTL